MRRPLRLSLWFLVLCLAVLLYLPGVDGPLLLDDKPALAENERAQIGGAVLDEWRTAALSSDSGPLRRPIAMLSFAGNYVLTGNSVAWSIKATNLALHLAIGALLYWLFLAVLDSLDLVADGGTRQLVALTAAAIWLLHPLNVSTVLYAVQRMAQLAALFMVAGLLVFVRFRQRWARVGASAGEVLAAGLWLLLLTALAALGKENGALLPWLLVVLEVAIFRGRWAGCVNRRLRAVAWVLLVAPVAVILLLYPFDPGLLQRGYAYREFTLEQRLFTQARLLWRYLGWICLPNINDMGFHHDDIPLSTGLLSPVTTLLSLAGWALLLAVAFLLRQRWQLLGLAVLFFLVGHSMESTIIPLEMVYEHRNYLPATMACLALAYLIVVPAARSGRVGVGYPLAGVFTVLGLLLFVRVQTWSDEVQLGRLNLVHHPESARANHLYANALLKKIHTAAQGAPVDGERRETLLLARHYFEHMYQSDHRDVAALVMLAYMDGTFFPQLSDQVDWLQPLQELLASRRLQPTDWNGLGLLFELAAADPPVAGRAQLAEILAILEERYPNSADVQRFRYQYLAAGNPDSPQLLAVLQQARQLAPGASWVYHMLLQEQARRQDVAGMYESARLWLANDPGRLHLNQVKALFADVPAGEGKADG